MYYCKSENYKFICTQNKKIIADIKEDSKNQIDPQISIKERTPVKISIPANVQVDKWYTSRVQEDLRSLWQLIESYNDHKKLISQVAFSAILLPVCKETRHWGYVCDNSLPKTNFEGNVLNEFWKVLLQLEKAYETRDQGLFAKYSSLSYLKESLILCEDSREALKSIKMNSINLVVTSPPYFGVSDYVKSQRLSMEWFGVDIEPLRLNEIGARSKRHRKKAIDEYIDDFIEVFRIVYQCLHESGKCVVIIGESEKRISIIPKLKESLLCLGFKFETEICREISKKRNQNPSIKIEYIYIFSK